MMALLMKSIILAVVIQIAVLAGYALWNQGRANGSLVWVRFKIKKILKEMMDPNFILISSSKTISLNKRFSS